MQKPLPSQTEADLPDPSKAPKRPSTPKVGDATAAPSGRASSVPSAVHLTEKAPCEGCP
ncbi:MAG: hypothetical protein K0S70_142 [Microbacterium sp.]|jgi:hypothetical protein|nr:hypothetical protein [Microbacterium sp.]